MNNKYIIDKFTNKDTEYYNKLCILIQGTPFISTHSDIFYIINYNNKDYINKFLIDINNTIIYRRINELRYGFKLHKENK